MFKGASPSSVPAPCQHANSEATNSTPYLLRECPFFRVDRCSLVLYRLSRLPSHLWGPTIVAKPEVERQKSILNVLQGMQGIEPLKKLFWTELNYDRTNSPLPRKGWGELASTALAEDPVLFATGGNDFQVIYARLNSDKLLMGMERPVVSRLLQNHPYALFVFSNAKQDRWHFVNVKYDDDAKRRRLFRRITIGPEERLRTASERLDKINLIRAHDHAPITIQSLHDEAFDVEAVTRDFFETFGRVYTEVANDIAAMKNLEGRAGSLAQLLLDRLLFLYFIQKKGWLNGEPDYLYSRLKTHCGTGQPETASFYDNVLFPLFLSLSSAGLNFPNVGTVPFLNGGLFEENPTRATAVEQARMQVSNRTFKKVFDELLERFNFTVTEDTPLDIEIAIDPEMLGKVFESLVLELEKKPGHDLRKITGSYYTSRAVVHFICQEALREYILSTVRRGVTGSAKFEERLDALFALPAASQLNDSFLGTLADLVDEEEARAIRDEVLSCRVCDPAVGSGAFPVGMLHEMVKLLGLLDARIHGFNFVSRRNYEYDLKRQIVEHCLYGVDVQEQAVRLCELRLWLSLIVDYQLEPSKALSDSLEDVERLPNLSFHIVHADSLIERLVGQHVHLELRSADEKINRLLKLLQQDEKAFFTESDSSRKTGLQLRTFEHRCQLATYIIDGRLSNRAGFQQHLLGTEAMTTSEREAMEEREDEARRLRQTKAMLTKAVDDLRDHPEALPVVRKYLGDKPTFVWEVNFAEVFTKKGGFDIVVTNPPYRKERESKHLMAEIQESPRWALRYEGKMDLWYLFLHLALDITHDHGIVHFITSRYWIAGQGAQKLISRIKSEAAVRIVCDLGNMKVFDQVSGLHMTAMYQKQGRPAPLTVKTFVKQDGSARIEAIDDHFSTDQVTVDRFADDSGLFQVKGRICLTTDSSGVVEVLESGAIPLSSWFEVRQGIAQNPDRISRKIAKEFEGKYEKGAGVFVLSDDELRQLRLTAAEMKFVVPFFEDYQVHPFATDERNTFWLLYLTAQNVASLHELSKLEAHLRRYKPLMDRRRETANGSNKWFHLHWPREQRLFEGPKIIGLQMAENPTFAYSDTSCYVGFGCNVIKTALNVDALFTILGVLNSSPAAAWFATHAKRRGVGLDIGGTVLKSFPIPRLVDTPLALRVAELAKQGFARAREGKSPETHNSRFLNEAVIAMYKVNASSGLSVTK